MSDENFKGMPTKRKSNIVTDYRTVREVILGAIWGMISFFAWLMLTGGPTSSANPPLTFIFLTLPASIPIMLSYYFINIPVTVMIILIPICGAIIVSLTAYIWKKGKVMK